MERANKGSGPWQSHPLGRKCECCLMVRGHHFLGCLAPLLWPSSVAPERPTIVCGTLPGSWGAGLSRQLHSFSGQLLVLSLCRPGRCVRDQFRHFASLTHVPHSTLSPCLRSVFPLSPCARDQSLLIDLLNPVFVPTSLSCSTSLSHINGQSPQTADRGVREAL